MNGWIAAILGLVLVVNPPGVARLAGGGGGADPQWRRAAARAMGIAVVALCALSAVTGPLLEAVDLSGPTFRLGAAVVMGITGGRWFMVPGVPIVGADSRTRASHLLLTMLAPGPVFAAMAANADAGAAAGLVAVAAAAAGTGALLMLRPPTDPAAGALTRMVGALTVVLAIAIGIDSARSV